MNAPLPPEWLAQAKKTAVEQLESQGRAIDAQVNAQRGQLEAQIVNAVASGKPAGAMLEDYMAHGGRQEFYEAMSGQEWVRSNPSFVNGYIQRLKNASPEDIPFILQEAQGAAYGKVISSRDFSAISVFGLKQAAIGRDERRDAETRGFNELLNQFRASGRVGGMPDFGPKVDEGVLRLDWETALINNNHNVAKAQAEVREKLGAYIRNGDAGLKGSLNRLVP